MDKYLTLADHLNYSRHNFDNLLELIIRGDEILTSVQSMADGIVDRGFLNPGESGYYYGLGKTATDLFTALRNLMTKVFVMESELERIRGDYLFPIGDSEHLEDISPLISSSGNTVNARFLTGFVGGQSAKTKNLFLRCGDVNGNYGFQDAPLHLITSVDVEKLCNLGWVQQATLDAIRNRAGFTTGSTKRYTYLVMNVDVASYLSSIINVSVTGKGGLESESQHIFNGYPNKYSVAFMPRYISGSKALTDSQVTFDRGELVIDGYVTEPRKNVHLMFGFVDTSRSGTGTFNLRENYPLDTSDVWLTSYLMRGVLSKSDEMYCVIRLAKFLRAMDADFTQAGFTTSTDSSQISNWCYNYINLNLAGTPLRNQILDGNSYLPIADGLANI